MQRFASVLRLRQGAEAAYEEHHRHLWPEVDAVLRATGIRHYAIYRHDRWLFARFELPDGVAVATVGQLLRESPACREWEAVMQTLQEPLPESGGHSWWVPMREVFHWDPEEPARP